MSTDRRSIGWFGLLGYHDMLGARDSKAKDCDRGDAVGRCASAATAAVSAISAISLFFLLFALLGYVIYMYFIFFILAVVVFKREKGEMPFEIRLMGCGWMDGSRGRGRNGLAVYNEKPGPGRNGLSGRF